MSETPRICECCGEPGGTNATGYRTRKPRRPGDTNIRLKICRWCERAAKGNRSIIRERNRLREEMDGRPVANRSAAIHTAKRILVGSDWHVPYHHAANVTAFCDYAKHFKPHRFVNAGDFLNFETLSRHDAGSLAKLEGRKNVEHFRIGNAVCDQIDDALGPACTEKDFIFGNHDDLIKRWLERGDNAVWIGDPMVDLPTRLMLYQRGYRVHENWDRDSVKLGKLHVIHGKYCNVHAASVHVNKLGCNVLYGHTHRMQMWIAHTLDGQRGGYGMGAMADFSAPELQYMGMGHGWSEGFADVHVRRSGNFQVRLHMFIDGVFYEGGKQYGQLRDAA